MALVVVVLVWPRKTSTADVLWHVTFLYGFHPTRAGTMTGVFWSLIPEVVLYCMLPLIVLKPRRLWVRIALFVGLFSVYVPISICAALSRAEGVQEGLASYVLTLPAAGPYFFIAGVLLRMLVEHLNSLPISPLQLM